MFKKIMVDTKFLSPGNGFKEDVQTIEYRKDTLTDTWCRVNVKRTERAKQCAQEESIEELIKLSKKGCAFCPENIDKRTPKFPPEVSKDGRIRRGESTVFPNLFPFARYHAMATVSEKHYRGLEDFTKTQVEDTINVSIDYFNRVSALGARYFTFNWNHLPPSGASILHPHVQLIADEVPTKMTSRYLRASEEYYQSNGENYWTHMIKEEEKLGERFIGRTGKSAWLSTFAPLGNNEVTMVLEGPSSILDLTKEEVSDIAEGLRRIFRGYSKMGKCSFNLTMYSGPVNMEEFCLNAKIITRPNPRKYYTADTGFMETLHHERVVETLPEALAAELRSFF